MAFEDCRGVKIFKHQHTNAVADSGTKKSYNPSRQNWTQFTKFWIDNKHFLKICLKVSACYSLPFSNNSLGFFAVFALILRLCIFFLFLLPFLMNITLPTYLTLKTPDTLCLGWGLASAGRDEQILRSFPETIVVEAWQWVVGNIHKKKCSLPSQVSTVCKYLAPSSNKRKTQLSLNFARAKVWLQKLQQPFWGFKSPRGVQFFALWMPHKSNLTGLFLGIPNQLVGYDCIQTSPTEPNGFAGTQAQQDYITHPESLSGSRVSCAWQGTTRSCVSS